MKKLLCLTAALGLVLVLNGCESELPQSGPDSGDKLRRGLTGQGSLYIPSADRESPATATFGR